MRLWRTIATFFLLLLLTAPLLFFCALQVRQRYIKQSLQQRLEPGLLKTVFISKQAWKQLNETEILVDGKWFDVKEIQKTKDGYRVTGIFDEEETAVAQLLYNAGNAATAKDIPLLAQAFQLLQNLFFQQDATPVLHLQQQAQLFQNPIAALPAFYKQILSPPPQLGM